MPASFSKVKWDSKLKRWRSPTGRFIRFNEKEHVFNQKDFKAFRKYQKKSILGGKIEIKEKSTVLNKKEKARLKKFRLKEGFESVRSNFRYDLFVKTLIGYDYYSKSDAIAEDGVIPPQELMRRLHLKAKLKNMVKFINDNADNIDKSSIIVKGRWTLYVKNVFKSGKLKVLRYRKEDLFRQVE